MSFHVLRGGNQTIRKQELTTIHANSQLQSRVMDSLTNGNGAHHDEPSSSTQGASTNGTTFDPEIFQNYLKILLPPVIGANPEDLESLFDDEFDERVARFAADTVSVVYVVQVKEESEGTVSFTFH